MGLEEKITYREGAVDCIAEIHPTATVKHFEVVFAAKNCKLIIGENCRFPRLNLYFLVRDTTVIIGKETVCNSSLWANLSGIGTTLSFGANCLLASVRARTSDSHHIIDLATNKSINPPGDVIVEDRVWLAEDVLLLKNTRIGSNSVIGARATVSGVIPPNCLAAGTPAKVLRENISWRYSGAHLTPPV